MLKKEAIEAGLSRYNTGKPCLRGHYADRLVSNNGCIQCSLEKRKVWRKENPDKAREMDRSQHAAHKEARNAQSREYRAKNPEKWKAISKASRAKRKDQIAAYMRDYRSAHRDEIDLSNKMYRQRFGEIMNMRTSEWRKNNRAAYLASKASRRAAEIQATPPWADHQKILAVYREAARLQLETGTPYHVDHILPLRGEMVCGLHVHFNLRPIPAEENIRKSNRFDPS